jgi:hypothetical protein
MSTDLGCLAGRSGQRVLLRLGCPAGRLAQRVLAVLLYLGYLRMQFSFQ